MSSSSSSAALVDAHFVNGLSMQAYVCGSEAACDALCAVCLSALCACLLVCIRAHDVFVYILLLF